MTTWNNLKFDLNKHNMDVFTRKLQWLASILYMTEDQTLEKFKDVFDMNIVAHLIECATLDEAREKAEQLVFIYKSNNPTPAPTVLLHTQQVAGRDIQEHQLAAIEKDDKQRNSENDKGGSNKPQRYNSSQQNQTTNPRGQSNPRQQHRGRFNYRGNSTRGRGSNQSHQRSFPRGRGYNRNRGYDNNYAQNRYDYQRGRGRSSYRQPWHSHGNYVPRGRGYMPSGTGDPQYKGIPQYKYLCGICHNRGHYDHQCHTLQHLFHAMQIQNGQNAQTQNTEYDNSSQNDQQTF